MIESIPWREIAELLLAVVAVLSRIQVRRAIAAAAAADGRKPRA